MKGIRLKYNEMLNIVEFLNFIWPDSDKIPPSEPEPTGDEEIKNRVIDEPSPNPDNYVKDKIYYGGVYTGYINLETELTHGQGTMSCNDGSKYVGEWEDGLRHGNGMMTFINGDRYDGSWKNGEKHGTGIYTWHNIERYEGEV